MRARIRVAVKDDKIVLRDPKTMERLTTKGKVVEKTPFWIRRLKAGDCVEIPEPQPVKEKPAAKAKKGGAK